MSSYGRKRTTRHDERRKRRKRRKRREHLTKQNTLQNAKSFKGSFDDPNDYDLWSKPLWETYEEQGIDVVENPIDKRIKQPPVVYPWHAAWRPGKGNTHPYYWEGHGFPWVEVDYGEVLGTESEPHNRVILNDDKVYVSGDIDPILKK